MAPRILQFLLNRGKQSITSDNDDDDYDPTAWLIHSSMAEFLLLHTIYMKYMVTLGYTYFNGCKLFGTLPPNSTMLYKYICMIFQCTGGGIIVPIILNHVPVIIAYDIYPICITISFIIHYYIPILRDVTHQSSILQYILILFYETMRASIIVKFTHLAHETIGSSSSMIGPIICGTLSGCGSMFVPFNKGIDAIQYSIPSSIISAFIASTIYQCCVNTTTLSYYIQPMAHEKIHVLIAIFLITFHYTTDYHHLKSLLNHSSTVTSHTVEAKKNQ